MSFKYVITDEIGIHARPAGLLVKECRKYKSVITIRHNGKVADAGSVLYIMALGIKCGDMIFVEVEGEDEEITSKKLEEFFGKNF